MADLTVFIGWDSREQEAYEVARSSVLKYADVEVYPIKIQDVIREQIYTRGKDALASSEFTLTRFLTPHLSDYKGFSLFMDCDILCQIDVRKILDEIDESNVVSCVQHDYTPKTDIKMDGMKQTVYPRKNWSSVMVFNNALCENVLNPDIVNTASPAYLHRMNWASDIGALNHTWNYLAGYYDDIEEPNIIHYTDGGPWFEEYRDCPLGNKWLKFYEENDISSLSRATEKLKAVQALHPIRGSVLRKA